MSYIDEAYYSGMDEGKKNALKMLTTIAKAAEEMQMDVMLDQGTSEPGFTFIPIKKGERPWIPAAALIGVDAEGIKEMVRKKTDYMKSERKRREKEMKGFIV